MSDHHSSLALEGDELVLRLRRRKNKPHGSVLRRACWCGERAGMCKTCPVHVLGKWVGDQESGTRPFHHWGPKTVRQVLRLRLVTLGIASAQEFQLHDFRRGHTKDLQRAKEPLSKILAWAEWQKPTIFMYCDLETLERDAVIDAHFDDSADED